MTRIVVALGGNALQKDGDTSAEAQKRVAADTARQLAILIKEGHQLVIAHGNGPQVGEILLAEEKKGDPAPLDTCGAMSQGEIGYWLQQGLINELRSTGINKPVATIVTQVVVDQDDQAFKDPSKPIGAFYSTEDMALHAAEDRNFVVKEDAGRGWRRVVPSPQPKDIIEADFIRNALENESIVIAAGGGGIPVVEKLGKLVGVEAVIDKDFAAEKLAEVVDADVLLILTAVPAISINYRKPNETNLGTVTPDELQKHVDDKQFAPGSMLPKVQAAIRFAQSKPGRTTIVTTIDQATEAVAGNAGTRITT